MGRFVIEGHRGARGLWPENTLRGFVAAAEMGVDVLELDAMLTADGEVAVTHDAWLNPDLTRRDGIWLTAPGPAVATMRSGELAQYDVGRVRPGSAAAAAFPEQAGADGERIPMLADVFAAVGGMPVIVDVELKTEPADPPHVPGQLADAVLAVARAAGAMSRMALRSFDWRGLRHVLGQGIAVPMTWLTDAETVAAHELWWDGVRLGEDGSVPDAVARAGEGAGGRMTWAPQHGSLTEPQLARAHCLGLRVAPWTVNATDDMARLAAWGVDGICTDYPDRALRLRALFSRQEVGAGGGA